MSEGHLADTAEYFPPVEAAKGRGTLPRVGVEVAALSHRGHVRPNNEDHYFVARVERKLEAVLTNLPSEHFPERTAETGYGLLVADGMGGRAAGEVASRSAIHLFLELILDTPDWIMRFQGELGGQVMQRMIERFRQIDAALSEWSRSDPDLAGMGTTMTLACSVGADLLTIHVGDSRAYLLRQGRLRRLTHDQTIAQELADAGSIDPAEVSTHRFRHVLTQALGRRGGEVRVEVGRIKLTDGDQLLLCTDGLTEMLADGVIAKELQASAPVEDVCHALIERALESGGRDNVTVALARYRFPPEG
jgi:serine/threonine protein phosphatase PrpC